MKTMKYLCYMCCIGMLLALSACSSDDTLSKTDDANVMRFEVVHPSQSTTRVTATNFENQDTLGVFVADAKSTLQVSGNYANNSKLTFDGTQWTSAKPIYWNDGTYNVYAYYPYSGSVTSIENYKFSVSTDQSVEKSDKTVSGYQASDFLWASAKSVTASNDAVKLKFSHVFSKVIIQLAKGSDYTGELPTTADVYIHNTVPSALIDLSAGYSETDPSAAAASIKAHPIGNYQYEAIVVPQRIQRSIPLIEIVTQGVSYLVESSMLFQPGMVHTFTISLTDNPEKININIGGQIENWGN